jgi:hypothetical protein
MRFLKKLFIVLLVIVVLGGVFYFVFERPRESDAKKNPLLDLFFGDEESEVSDGIFSDSKKFIDEKISSVKESIKESFQKKEEEFSDSLRGRVNKVIDATQEKVIGVEVESGNITVLQTVRIGADAYFLISNPDSSGSIQYEIDWGDGLTESGVLSGENKTVSHSWDEEGDFLVVFKTSGSDSVSESIKVFVTR